MGRDLREKIIYMEKYCCRGGSSSNSNSGNSNTESDTSDVKELTKKFIKMNNAGFLYKNVPTLITDERLDQSAKTFNVIVNTFGTRLYFLINGEGPYRVKENLTLFDGFKMQKDSVIKMSLVGKMFNIGAVDYSSFDSTENKEAFMIVGYNKNLEVNSLSKTKEDLEKTGIDICNMSNFSVRPLNIVYPDSNLTLVSFEFDFDSVNPVNRVSLENRILMAISPVYVNKDFTNYLNLNNQEFGAFYLNKTLNKRKQVLYLATGDVYRFYFRINSSYSMNKFKLYKRVGSTLTPINFTYDSSIGIGNKVSIGLSGAITAWPAIGFEVPKNDMGDNIVIRYEA